MATGFAPGFAEDVLGSSRHRALRQEDVTNAEGMQSTAGALGDQPTASSCQGLTISPDLVNALVVNCR